MRTDEALLDMTAATVGALQALERGHAPVFRELKGRPDDPTPLYDLTAFRLGYSPVTLRNAKDVADWQTVLRELEQARAVAGIRPSGLARLPIPARPLSYQARARRTDPQTSHDAARSVTKISETHDRILGLLRFYGPMTDETIATDYQHAVVDGRRWPPVSPSGLRTRRRELVDMGKVVDSGERARTSSGRASIVWKLADGQ